MKHRGVVTSGGVARPPPVYGDGYPGSQYSGNGVNLHWQGANMTARIVSLGVVGLAEWSANRQKGSLLAAPFAIMEGDD